jgi:methyl-accepting chemotaxis protein
MTEIYTPPLTAKLEQMLFTLTHSFKELSAKLNGINIGDHEALTQFITQTTGKLQQVTTFMAQTTLTIGELSLAVPHLQQITQEINSQLAELSSELATISASITHDPEVDRTEIVTTNHIKLST